MPREKRFKNNKEYKKWWEKQNHEKMNEYRREWIKKWRKENPELARGQDREKREKYKERRANIPTGTDWLIVLALFLIAFAITRLVVWIIGGLVG